MNSSPIYPGFAFCASWAVSLLIIAATGDLFYRLSPETLVVFICGGCVVTVACGLGSILPSKAPMPVDRQASNRILTALLWVVVLSTPIFLYWLKQAVAAEGGNSPFLMIARVVQMKAIDSGGNSAFRAAGYLIELAQDVAVLCLWEKKGHEKRAVIAIIFAFIVSLPFGQKSAPITLALALICVDWIQNRKMRWKLVMSMVLVMVSITATFEFYVHLGGGSIAQNATGVARNFALYASGGVMGFDQVMRDPKIVTHVNAVDVVGLRIARRFGAQVVIPEVYEFVNVGPYGLNGNVFTIFWPFLNWGWIANMFTVGLICFISTRVYGRAMQGGMPWVPLYARIFFGLVFSTFSEYFAQSLYLYAILIITNWIVYSSPIRIAQFRNLNHSIVQAEFFSRGIALNAPFVKARKPFWLLSAYRHFRFSIRQSVKDGLRRTAPQNVRKS